MCAKLSLGLLFFQLFWILLLLTSHLVTVFNVAVKPGFHISGKSQTIEDFTVSRLSQIVPTNGNSKS